MSSTRQICALATPMLGLAQTLVRRALGVLDKMVCPSREALTLTWFVPTTDAHARKGPNDQQASISCVKAMSSPKPSSANRSCADPIDVASTSSNTASWRITNSSAASSRLAPFLRHVPLPSPSKTSSRPPLCHATAEPGTRTGRSDTVQHGKNDDDCPGDGSTSRHDDLLGARVSTPEGRRVLAPCWVRRRPTRGRSGVAATSASPPRVCDLRRDVRPESLG